MTKEEMREVIKCKQERITIKRNVAALYLLSDLNEVWSYLWAKIDDNYITEEEAEKLLDEVTDFYANKTFAEIQNIRKMFF